MISNQKKNNTRNKIKAGLYTLGILVFATVLSILVFMFPKVLMGIAVMVMVSVIMYYVYITIKEDLDYRDDSRHR